MSVIKSARHRNKMLDYLDYSVRVILCDNHTFVGTLMSYDKHKNLILKDSIEVKRYTPKKSKEMVEDKRTLGLILLRGENIVSVMLEDQVPDDSDSHSHSYSPSGSSAGGEALSEKVDYNNKNPESECLRTRSQSFATPVTAEKPLKVERLDPDFLDARNNFAFKKIFGTENNKHILIHFLNTFLEFAGRDHITDITFLATIPDTDLSFMEQRIADVLCKDQGDTNYIIEMQGPIEANRHSSKVFSTLSNKGDSYKNLKETVFIAIADCTLFPHKEEFISSHTRQDLKGFVFIFIELPKFAKTFTEVCHLKTKMHRWCWFLRFATQTGEEDIRQVAGSDEIIETAYNLLKLDDWTMKEINRYEVTQMHCMDERAIYESQCDEYEREYERGYQLGKKRAQLGFAKSLLQTDLSVDVIVRATGLSHEEIRRLQKDFRGQLTG